nr:unnamed protein product [Callosobruchus analis]
MTINIKTTFCHPIIEDCCGCVKVFTVSSGLKTYKMAFVQKSAYLQQLEKNAAARYMEKSRSFNMWTHFLGAYKFYEAGFVHDCGAKKIGDHIVVVGKVSCKGQPITKLSDINLKAQKPCSDVVLLDDPTCTKPPLEGQALQAFLRKMKDDGDSVVLFAYCGIFCNRIKPRGTKHSKHRKSIINSWHMLIYATWQNQCFEWYKQRDGRITGSCFKRVCHTSIVKPSLTTVKAIC